MVLISIGTWSTVIRHLMHGAVRSMWVALYGVVYRTLIWNLGFPSFEEGEWSLSIKQKGKGDLNACCASLSELLLGISL